MNRRQRRQTERERPHSAVAAGYAEALDRFKAQRLDEAERLLRQTLARDREHADSLHLLGLIAHQAGRFGSAVELIGRAVTLNGKSANYRNNLGLALIKTGAAGAAVQAFQESLALAPGKAEIHANLGRALRAAGNGAEAIRQYEMALALKPGLLDVRCDLAALLYATGRQGQAIAQYERALALNPSFALARHNLGRVHYDGGDFPRAEDHLRRYLALDPSDRFGARLLLAAMGRETVPAMASEAFLRHIYAERAGWWDARSTGYHAHRLVAEALDRHRRAPALDVLDAGCGTGLVGPLVRPVARRLAGVDLSPEMLAGARERAVYDELHEAEMTAWLTGVPDRYDAILSAATLIHFGDLRPVFRAASGALRQAGLLAFTLFPSADPANDDKVVAAPDDRLAMGGCFSHGRSYVRRIAAESGFLVEELAEETHEEGTGGRAVPGMVVVLRKGLSAPA
jgi:predicted TPR repeat methyltransferase